MLYDRALTKAEPDEIPGATVIHHHWTNMTSGGRIFVLGKHNGTKRLRTQNRYLEI